MKQQTEDDKKMETVAAQYEGGIVISHSGPQRLSALGRIQDFIPVFSVHIKMPC